MVPGRNNLITDVTGLTVGNAADPRLISGVTVLHCDSAYTAGVDIRGGAPGTSETALLTPGNSVEKIDAILLSGGSAFGLAAADATRNALADARQGLRVGDAIVPIVPAAILFDLANGGDKNWPREQNPYHAMAQAALADTRAEFSLGNAGAGYGASVSNLKGGLGSASCVTPAGHMVGALVAVNAAGGATVGDTPYFWAAPWEINSEFGGLGLPSPLPPAPPPIIKTGFAGANTTLAIVATDAKLTVSQARRVAICAHDGLARALYPVHTPIDGDIVFAVATGRSPLPAPDLHALSEICAIAATTLARAIARAVYLADSLENSCMPPSWRKKFMVN